MPDEYAPLHGSSSVRKPSNFHTQSLAWLVMTPFLTFFTIMACFTFLYYDSSTVCWMWVLSCAGMACCLCAIPSRRPEGPSFYLQLGGLCLIAIGVGTALGYYNWDRHMSFAAAYGGQRSYSNVLPTEPALSHLDAGKIVFSSDSKLKKTTSVGYRDGDSTYCVAAVIDSTAQSASTAHYFAAGVDCCDAKGSFTCDEADNKKAHSGLVYLKFGNSDLLSKFRKAAQALAAAQGVIVAKDALFVKWVRDVDKAGNSYQNSGISFFLGTSLVYLVLSTAAGFTLHFGHRVGSRSRITKNIQAF